jgi:hypothetical protein
MPAVVLALVLGVGMGAAAAASGRLGLGLGMLGIVAGAALLLVVGSRVSDTVALLGDDIHEERHAHLHQRAALYTLNILGLVIVGGFIVDLARGGDGSPWSFLGFVAGVVYVGSLLILNRRS